MVAMAAFLIAVVFWFQLQHTMLGPPLDWCFDRYCHRFAQRSLYLSGEPLPVCARCTGVIAGYLLAAAAAVCGAEKLWFWRIRWAIALMGLMVLSWLGGTFGILPQSWHWERVVAGFCGGAGGYIFIACVVVFAIKWFARRESALGDVDELVGQGLP